MTTNCFPYGMLRRELHETHFAASRQANLGAIRLLPSIRANWPAPKCRSGRSTGVAAYGPRACYQDPLFRLLRRWLVWPSVWDGPL